MDSFGIPLSSQLIFPHKKEKMSNEDPPSLLAFPHDSTIIRRCKRSRANEAKGYPVGFGLTSLEGLKLGPCVDRRVNLKAINDGGPESVAYAA